MSRTREVRWAGFLLAVIAHVSFSFVGSARPEQRAAKPLTTRFVKRAPRLAKPLELKKRPAPKRRHLRREMAVVKARADRKDTGREGRSVEVVRRLARPRAPISRSATPPDAYLERQALAEAIQSTRDAGAKMDASLELMGIDALDTGKYHAMIIQDPSEKRGVRGYFHLALADSRNMFLGRWAYLKPRFVRAMVRLVGAMNKHTAVRTNLVGRIGLDSEELLKTPWVYVMTAFNLRFTESESNNFGAYLVFGGTALLDDLLHVPGGPGDVALRELLIAALSTQGLEFQQDWHFERLPKHHPIYHCYFDFDGPPLGVYLPEYFATVPVPGNTVRLADYLEGVYLGERMAIIMSNQSYANAWGDWGPDGTTARVRAMYGHLDPRRPLQFGVNLIVFALTQEGAITHQVMESVGY